MSGYLACCCVDKPSPCTCDDAGEPFATVSSFYGMTVEYWREGIGCESCGSYPSITHEVRTTSSYAENQLRLECDGYSTFTEPDNADDRAWQVSGSYVDNYAKFTLYRRGRCGNCQPNDPNPHDNALYIDTTNAAYTDSYDLQYALDNNYSATSFPGGQAQHLQSGGVSLPEDVQRQYVDQNGEEWHPIDGDFYRIFRVNVNSLLKTGQTEYFNRDETCQGVDTDSISFNFSGGQVTYLVQINHLGPTCDVDGEGSFVLSYVQDGNLPEYEDPLGNRYALLPYDKTTVQENSGPCEPQPFCGFGDCPPVKDPDDATDLTTRRWRITAGVIGWSVEP